MFGVGLLVAADEAQEGAYLGQEFAGGEGFGEVGVGAALEAGDFFPGLVFGGEHDDGYVVLPLAHAAGDFVAVEAGHHDVKDDEVGLLREFVEGFGAGAGDEGFVAGLLEEDGEGAGDGLFVVYDENGRGRHGGQCSTYLCENEAVERLLQNCHMVVAWLSQSFGMVGSLPVESDS